MLIACRRTATSFYNRRESIFASFVADRIFTSFRTFESKRADSEILDLSLCAISCQASVMDPNSIITQVSRNQDQLNTYQSSLTADSRGKK